MRTLVDRARRLRRRLGLWKVLRACAVALFLVLFSAYMMVRGESAVPLIGALAGLIIPRCFLRFLVDRFGFTRQLLRFWGPALIVVAVVVSIVRERIELPGQVLIGGITALLVLATAYVSTLFWVASDDRLTFPQDEIAGLH